MTFLYFAYGSNMLPGRLQARCASTRVIGTATAAGFDLEFSKKSTDGSGKATLITASNIVTPGVVFEIDKADLGSLDAAEGPGYSRLNDFTAALSGTGQQITTTTYIADTTNSQLRPFDWYLALVIAGAHFHALDDEHMRRLRRVERSIDGNRDRKTRCEALKALSSHGFDDYHALLTNADNS